MNRVKRTARKRHIRQTINRAKLEGREALAYQNGGIRKRDLTFALEVAAKQKPYFTTTPFKARLRAAFGLPIFG